MAEKKHDDKPLEVTASVNDGTGMIPVAPRDEYEAGNYASLLNLNPLGMPAATATSNMLEPPEENKAKKTDRRFPWNR